MKFQPGRSSANRSSAPDSTVGRRRGLFVFYLGNHNRPYGLLTGYPRYFNNVQRNWGKERSEGRLFHNRHWCKGGRVYRIDNKQGGGGGGIQGQRVWNVWLWVVRRVLFEGSLKLNWSLKESSRQRPRSAMSWKNPGEVRARTCGTKSPSRSEALRFIDSSKSPSTKIDGSLVNFRCRQGLCLELSFNVLYCRTQANPPTLKLVTQEWASNRLDTPRCKKKQL